MANVGNDEWKDPFEFTSEDRLALLQLSIRKSMSDRRSGESVAEDGEETEETDESSTEAEPEDDVLAMPEKWRLIPPGTNLHSWQKECLDIWLEKGRGTAKVATGGGKTMLALAVAEALQNTREPDLRFVVVVPTVPLMYQWRDELTKGNVTASAIGLIGGGHPIPDLKRARVVVAVLNSAREKLHGLVFKAGCAAKLLLVVDECHRANAMKAQNIFKAGARYTLGLSATPESELDSADVPGVDTWNESPAGRAIGPIIYDFSIRQSLDEGLLTPFEVWHVGVPLNGDESCEHQDLSRRISELRQELQARHKQARSNQRFLAWCQTLASRRGDPDAVAFIGLANMRKRLLYRAEARREATHHFLAEGCADPESRSIVFHESIDEIEHMFVEALRRGLPVTLEHSKLPSSVRDASIEAFRKGDARGIVSAKSLVEGFNVPSADLGVIAASSGSVRQRIQSLGRLLRRKAGDRAARIVVLYVQDTEDEAIYEKADWESVIGAERNRYFKWSPPADSEPWSAGLEETNRQPRIFRPPSSAIDVSSLAVGAPYPGQIEGEDLRVDDSGNLRDSEKALIDAPRELVSAIVSLSPFRRARRTPAGHVIVRSDAPESGETPDWLFAGELRKTAEPSSGQIAEGRYRLKSARGRRVIAKVEAVGRIERFGSGQVADCLVAWASELERQRNVRIGEVFWRSGVGYWVEVEGERLTCPDAFEPLEFGA